MLRRPSKADEKNGSELFISLRDTFDLTATRHVGDRAMASIFERLRFKQQLREGKTAGLNWQSLRDYNRKVGDFYRDMECREFVKAAASLGFVPVRSFDSPVTDKTIVFARAVDAQIMLASLQFDRIESVELNRCRSRSATSHVFERRWFGKEWGTITNLQDNDKPMECLADFIVYDSANRRYTPVTKWWSHGSGADQWLSWHHRLFTRAEIDFYQSKFGALETIGQERRDAVHGVWREVFDLGRERTLYVVVDEMEQALSRIIP